MDCSTPGFPIHHQFPEFAQTYVHWISNAIQLSVLCYPLLLPPSIFPRSRVFSNKLVHRIRLKYWSFSFSTRPPNEYSRWSIWVSASAPDLPMNIQDWFPLGLSDWISLLSKGFSRVFSNTTVQTHQFFRAQPAYGLTLTSIHDYWKNHSFN